MKEKPKKKIEISKIPVSKRWSFVFLEKGYLEVDGWAVVLRQKEKMIHIPIGMFCCLMIGPGVVVTQPAVRACAAEQTLLAWVGEEGVRCYSAGMPGGHSGTHIIRQATMFSDSKKRLAVARRFYFYMMGEEPPENRSIDQLRGIEGSRVKKCYRQYANEFGVKWDGRVYDVHDFNASDPVNMALSVANVTLYSLAEAVILSLGYTPAIGFIHTGHARSLAFDLADAIKMETVSKKAFEIASSFHTDIERSTRLACRDFFHNEKIAGKLVTILEDAFNAADNY